MVRAPRKSKDVYRVTFRAERSITREGILVNEPWELTVLESGAVDALLAVRNESEELRRLLSRGQPNSLPATPITITVGVSHRAKRESALTKRLR